MNNLCVIGHTNWRFTNVPWASEVKEQQRKCRQRMSDNLFQFFPKINLKPLSSSSPISFSYLVCFEWFRIWWWVHQLGLYKNPLYSRGKDAMIKDFKLEILICLNSPIIKNWILWHQTPHMFLVPLSNWAIFVMLEGLWILFEFHKQETMCESSTSFELLSVCSLPYLHYHPCGLCTIL